MARISARNDREVARWRKSNGGYVVLTALPRLHARRSAGVRGYDNWKTSPPEAPYSARGEDLLGKRVVLGLNDHGLGRWGTLVGYDVERDDDEDGSHTVVTFEVEFQDSERPRRDYMDECEVLDQFAPPRA